MHTDDRETPDRVWTPQPVDPAVAESAANLQPGQLVIVHYREGFDRRWIIGPVPLVARADGSLGIGHGWETARNANGTVPGYLDSIELVDSLYCKRGHLMEPRQRGEGWGRCVECSRPKARG